VITRNEVQLDITRDKPIDDNAFTAETRRYCREQFQHSSPRHPRATILLQTTRKPRIKTESLGEERPSIRFAICNCSWIVGEAEENIN
jgi:hypothetical protein